MPFHKRLVIVGKKTDLKDDFVNDLRTMVTYPVPTKTYGKDFILKFNANNDECILRISRVGKLLEDHTERYLKYDDMHLFVVVLPIDNEEEYREADDKWLEDVLEYENSIQGKVKFVLVGLADTSSKICIEHEKISQLACDLDAIYVRYNVGNQQSKADFINACSQQLFPKTIVPAAKADADSEISSIEDDLGSVSRSSSASPSLRKSL